MEKSFGEFVKEQREAKGLKSAHCARLSGMTAQQWGHMERTARRPLLDTVLAVSHGLEMPFSRLLLKMDLEIGPGDCVPFLDKLESILRSLSANERAKVLSMLEADAARYAQLLSSPRTDAE